MSELINKYDREWLNEYAWVKELANEEVTGRVRD